MLGRAAVVPAHSQDAVCVCVSPLTDRVYTGGREGSVSVWLPETLAHAGPGGEGRMDADCTHPLGGGGAWVYSLALVPPQHQHQQSEDGGEGEPEKIAVGERYGNIFVLESSLQESQPRKVLHGHEEAVVSLHWVQEAQQLVSGSNDGTVRVWNICTGECLTTMAGMENSVHALPLSPSVVVAVSSGLRGTDGIILHNMRVWQNGEEKSCELQHESSIRCICPIPTQTAGRHGEGEASGTQQFATSGNDGAIKIWEFRSAEPIESAVRCVGTYGVSDAFIYSLVARESDGALAACAESGEVIILSRADGDGDQWTLGQTLRHPRGVWDATWLANNDLATVCSDGALRIWSADNERQLSAEDGTEAERRVATYYLETHGGMQKRTPQNPILAELGGELPKASAAATHVGESDGAISLFLRDDGQVEARQWSGSDEQWTVLGTLEQPRPKAAPTGGDDGEAADGKEAEAADGA